MSEQEKRIWQLNSVRTGPRGETPIIFVHAVGLDLTYWDSQIEEFCDRYDVVAFDLPGHGESPGTSSDWTIEQAITVLQQIMHSSNFTSAHIVGLSVGGILAQAFALAHPELVHSLVLIATAPTFSDDAREAMKERAAQVREEGMTSVIGTTLKRWFTDKTVQRRPDLIDRVIKTLRADDPYIHGAMWEMISEIEFVSNLNRIACPTLIITGDLDQSTPLSSAKILSDNIRNSELHIVPGISHMVPLEVPSLVNKLIEKFFLANS